MTPSGIQGLRRFRTLPIRIKLAMVSVLVVLALASIPSVSWYRDVAIRDMDDTRLQILALDGMVLSLQRSQNDFINRFDPFYRDEFSDTFETFVEQTEELKVKFWDLGLPADKLEQLVVLTSEYQYMFEVLAELQGEIGQDGNEGIRRRIHNHLGELEHALEAIPNDTHVRDALHRRVISLQVPAQGLLLDRRQHHIVEFLRFSGELNHDIHSLIRNPEARAKLLGALSRFTLAFEDLARATDKVGMTYDSGLLGEIGQTVEATKSVLAALKTQVNAAIEHRERQLNITLVVLAVFFSFTFVVAVVVLARSISRPIRDVTNIMTRLADGDLSVAIPNEPRRDEVGDMLRALRVFKMGAIIRRRTQEELRKAHTELEQRVEERTQALSEEIVERRHAEQELLRAREDAEKANHAKSMFLANMSHELRTPLNAIIGYADMLQEDARDLGDNRLCDDLDKIHGAGKHLLGIINEILDLSKIEAGRVDLHMETFPVTDIIESVTGTVRPLIAANNNTLKIDIDGDPGTMESDMTRLRQILFNLLSNASKFTTGGTITLTCRRETRAAADWVVFHVSDTGIGLEPEQIEKIFEPFTQADTSTTRKYGGTGLGLTVNREFAHLLGGEIDVQSTPGQGTTFSVTLPAQAPAPAHPEDTAP